MAPKHMQTGSPRQAGTTVVKTRRGAWLLAALLLVSAPALRADVTDIKWSADGSFERSLNLATGRFSELCGALQVGQSVEWQFESDQLLDFNIHYHQGQAVHYPVRADQVRQQRGHLAVDSAQDYCWMWSNKSAANALLRVRLRLRQ
jgi:hypothetical protein